LTSLVLNLVSIRLETSESEQSEVIRVLTYMLEDPRCKVAQALCTIRGLQKLDIIGWEDQEFKRLQSKLREYVTTNI